MSRRQPQVQTASRGILQRLVLALLGWWIISEGAISALPAGLPAAAAAVALSLVLAPRICYPIRPLGLLRFVGFFLWHSAIAGADVARRILHPRLPIDPQLVRIPLNLTDGAPRWLLGITLGLLPGTLVVAFERDTLALHCLSRDSDPKRDVRRIERRVAAVFEARRGGRESRDSRESRV